jgi:protein-tyrosine phosphatase
MARWVRYAPDRILHPGRRRRALGLLGTNRKAESILFICYGNICRSPYAAEAFRRRLPESLQKDYAIGSAGLFGHDRPSPDRAVKIALRRGIDLTGHRSTLLSRVGIAGSNLIVVMSREQQKVIAKQYRRRPETVLILGDLDPVPIGTRTITDPYAHPDEVFDSSFARIDRCIDVLVGALAAPDRPVEAVARSERDRRLRR